MARRKKNAAAGDSVLPGLLAAAQDGDQLALLAALDRAEELGCPLAGARTRLALLAEDYAVLEAAGLLAQADADRLCPHRSADSTARHVRAYLRSLVGKGWTATVRKEMVVVSRPQAYLDAHFAPGGILKVSLRYSDRLTLYRVFGRLAFPEAEGLTIRPADRERALHALREAEKPI
jgi:hypothetical protein